MAAGPGDAPTRANPPAFDFSSKVRLQVRRSTLRRLSTSFSACFLTVATAGHGIAQTSTALLLSDPHQQYYAMKKAMQALYEAGSLCDQWACVKPGNAGKDKEYILSHCGWGGHYVPFANDPDSKDYRLTATLTNLAYDIVKWRNELRAYGFPEGVWRPAMIKYEDDAVDFLTSNYGSAPSPTSGSYDAEGFHELLAHSLNEYRRMNNPALPHVEPEVDGCGAGEQMISFRTTPPGGRVRFIPVYYYLLCKAQSLDPDDPQKCDRWREASDNQIEALAGDYYYVALWPDGKQTQRTYLNGRRFSSDRTLIFQPP
jgi:hypothetical protein